MKFFFTSLLLLTNFFSFCQWSTNATVNNLVCTGFNNQYASRVVSDGSGGVIFTWFDYTAATNDHNIYAQRINSAGITLWTANGVGICTEPGTQSPPVIISDGNGGAIIAWQDNRIFTMPAIYVQRINSSGVVQWVTNGVYLGDGVAGQSTPQLVSDGNGGAIIVYKAGIYAVSDKIYAQRINAAGAIQWVVGGVSMTTSIAAEQPQIVSDGAGGAIISWNEFVGPLATGAHHIYAQRVNSAGVTLWGPAGINICNAPLGQVGSQLTTDGNNGAIIIWRDARNSPAFPSNVYAQRVNPAGIIQWAVNGIAVAPIAAAQTDPKVMTDGIGGAYVTWWLGNTLDQVWVQRINSSGVPQWAAAGIRISTTGNSRGPEITTDGGTGAIITWYTVSSGNNIYAQRINSAGVIQWTANGVGVCLNFENQTDAHIIANGNGGAYISWTDSRNNAANGSDIYASLLNSDGTLGTIPPGMLDPAFGTGGIVTTLIGTASRIRAMAIQADGKIVVAGLSHTGADKDFGVARYNTNGTLDNSFDGDGKVITAISVGFDNIALCVAIQADGKIVVGGYTNTATDADFALVRYNANGSLDNSFDGDGIVITSFGPANTASIHGIAIQADGKIVVAGLAYSGTDNDFALARYNTDGSLDNSFDGDGKVLTPIGVSNDAAYSIVLQADGKIAVAGFTSFPIKFALARYNTNGSLDNSFDGDGMVTTTIGSGGDIAYSLALQADGKLLAAGQSYNGSDYDFALARYNTNGTPDNSFDGDGKLTSAIGPFGDIAYAVAIQVDGKIVTAGYCETLSTNTDFAVARFNSNGSPDNSFDGDGKVMTNINGFDIGYAMKLSGLRIYVGGVSNDDIFTLVAYQNDALPVVLPLQLTSFTAIRKGKNIELNWQTATEQNTDHFSIERSSDGRQFASIGIVNAAGNSTSIKNYSFTDIAPNTGINFYRLRQTDIDGKFTYSPILRVTMNGSEFVLSISPNPAKDVINIVYTGKKQTVTISIYDAQGRLMQKQTRRNELPITVDLRSLEPGVYFIQLSDGETVQKTRFVKQ